VTWDTTDAFDTDFRRLRPEHQQAFADVVRKKFAPACDAYHRDPSTPWPRSLRVKSVRGASGVLEMTWSFASPDGRATFELITVDGGLVCLWRRVGSHEVFRRP
jgi:hypothetical protein